MSLKAKRININLFDEHSIVNAMKELTVYKNSLQNKVNEIALRLADLGVDCAISNLVSYQALFTGELISSIHQRKILAQGNQAIYLVVADSEHACFVEFGTGYKGLANPYPTAVPPGNYGGYTGYVSGAQILENAKKGLYGWYYPGDDGKWYFTEGMPSRPFMYDTANELYKAAYKIVREVFSR